MNAVAATIALPAAAAVIWLVLRTPLARLVVARPSGDRWHERATPLVGGVGIFAGLVAASALAVAAGPLEASRELYGVLGGAALLFAAGLIDDVRALGPAVKLAVQVGAAALVLWSGLHVEIVENDVAATAIGLLWLVGMTNAFNLLDNMDGLAATLAGIAALYFAVDAVTVHPNQTVLVLSLGLGLACIGFLPYNIRPGRPAAVFMGDSGSQLLGFVLASLGLAASWKVAGSTFATVLLPVLVLAVPILDTTLVTVVRLLEGRPVHRGGRDHTSHRLVYRGLSETRALVLLAGLSIALGGTSLAYTVLNNARLTLVGVLLTFAMLVQFASYLAQVDRRPSARRRLIVSPRRLLETCVDFAVLSASFLGAYLLVVGGSGTVGQRTVFLVSLPVLLAARYLAFMLFGLYKGVWRYAGARDAASVVLAVVLSGAVAVGFLAVTQDFRDFPLAVYVVDALLATTLVGATRFGERALESALASLHGRETGRRTLIVGAGRAGRSLLRELRETSGERVVGFVDDDPALRGRRMQGIRVLGDSGALPEILDAAGADRVLVTIPDAPRGILDAVVDACEEAGVACRFVRREIDLDPNVVLGAAAK